jgi:hypothetical protein
MTDPQNPITPPPELVEQWREKWSAVCGPFAVYLATQAAQWGADQELEACKQYMHDQDWFMSPTLRMSQLHNARRPKPPSLKEQALEALKSVQRRTTDPNIIEPIRRALEALND